jgi:hypothetical protein
MSVSTAQKRLAVAWLALAVPLLLVLFAQTLTDRPVFGSKIKAVWGWFLPMIVPTLSLIVGTVATQARQPQSTETVDETAYRIALVLSVLYLLAVMATLVASATSRRPMEMLDDVALFLAALQALVGYALGAFFVSKANAKSDVEGTARGARGPT